MIKLNDDNIYVGQIKQLLKGFNLPTFKVYKEGGVFVEGNHYLKDGYITIYKEGSFINETLYVFDREYLNLTKHLVISNNIYDSYTHRYLGEYLRFIRDYKGVDLMSMYNCNDDYTANDLSIKLDKDKYFGTEEGYVVYCFPVKFNNKYTIGINNPLKTEIVVGFYDNDKIVDYNEITTSIAKQTHKNIHTSLSSPYVYDSLYNINASTDMKMYEDTLTMFIKVPFSLEASLVVLEGDYSKNFKVNLQTKKFLDSFFKYLDYDGEICYYNNDSFLSKIELMSYLNADGNYLLATRLIEYLSNNVISPLSESYDIVKLQKKLINKKLVGNELVGVWNADDRRGVYNFISSTNLVNEKYDMLSYLDKDAEQVMGDIE